MPGGRPTKLTLSLCEQVEALAQELPHLEMLAAHLGVHYATLRRWIIRGEAEQLRVDAGRDPRPECDLFLRFCESVKKGLAALYRECLKDVRSGQIGWQGRAWVLERRWQDLCGANAPELRRMVKSIREEAKAAAKSGA